VPNEFVEILRSLAKRPAFYLARSPATLDQLQTFICGASVGNRYGQGLSALDAFDEWVLWRHGVPDLSDGGWPRLILKRAGDDEAAAFQLFFNYLEEYLVERDRIGADGIRAGLRASLHAASD